jgi:hypothetical protein
MLKLVQRKPLASHGRKGFAEGAWMGGPTTRPPLSFDLAVAGTSRRIPSMSGEFGF